MLSEQTALQASLIWEQQMQICKMNEAYLQLSDEKERIVLADNRLVHQGMEHITNMMLSLQESLQQRHEVLAANMDPINSPLIAETIQKLKTALHELHIRNAQLVMRNNELKLIETFTPPKMGTHHRRWVTLSTKLGKNDRIIMRDRGLTLITFT